MSTMKGCISRIALLFLMVFLKGAAKAPAQDNYYYPNSPGYATQSRGWGGVIQAQGQRNLSNSQAAINRQDAYSAAIDNNIKSVNAYYQKQDIHDQATQKQDYEDKQKHAAYRARHALQPLTPQEFDRTTGQINWPKLLDQSQYDEYRATLDDFFKKRAQSGMLTGDDYMAATTASKEWRTLLAKQKNEYPREVLSEVTRFILKLNVELNDNLS